MKFLLWIALGLVGIYLLLVIPAGIAVLIRHWRFPKTPDRDVVLGIIGEYHDKCRKNERLVLELVAAGRREAAERSGVVYSVDISAKKLRDPRSYEVRVSVSRLKLFTIGYGESTVVSFS